MDTPSLLATESRDFSRERFKRRNLALVIISLSIIIILSSFTYAFLAKDNITFRLEDLDGNRSVLHDITIEGILQDGYHGEYFAIDKGEVRHSFKYYDNAGHIFGEPISYYTAIAAEGFIYNYHVDYKISSDAHREIVSTETEGFGNLQDGDYKEITRTILTNKVDLWATITKMKKGGMRTFEDDLMRVNTGITRETKGMDFEFTQQGRENSGIRTWDEPFLGKDMFTRQDFLKLMVISLKGEETILIATHLIGEIENFIDRAIILRFGRIKEDFYIDDMRSQGKNLASVMGDVSGYDEERYKGLL